MGAWREGPVTAEVIRKLQSLQLGKLWYSAFCTGQSLGKQLESRGSFMWWGINMQSSYQMETCEREQSL